MNTPSERNSIGSRANIRTSRGEEAIALNCIITTPTENTMPVKAIMPEATAAKNDCARATKRPLA
jgi:hypothetical protein